MTAQTAALLEGLQEHILGLYAMPDGTTCRTYEDDQVRLRACAEAIDYMRASEKFEPVTMHGRLRTACEVVAYYELEEFVAAA